MDVLIFGVISISVSVFFNSLLVYLKKNKKGIFTKTKKWSILIHGMIIVPLWISTFLGVIYLSLKDGLSSSMFSLVTSVVVYMSSLIIFYFSVAALGWGSLVNRNVFEGKKNRVVKSGVFKYFNNPMYVSFDLFFVALGLLTGNVSTVLVAAYLFVGLNLVQSKIETP